VHHKVWCVLHCKYGRLFLLHKPFRFFIWPFTKGTICSSDNCQPNFYWFPCFNLLRVVVLVLWCTLKVAQILVLCIWYELHVGSMKRKYALNRPIVSKIWSVQVKTNLTQDEIKSFEEVGFVLNKRQSIFPRSLFERESSIPINRPLDEMLWPTPRNGKAIIVRCHSRCQIYTIINRLTSWSNCKPTIGGSPSLIWTNL
jgi:hypothetical protein